MDPIRFETSPDRYKHWVLTVEGPVARLGMNIPEDGGLRPGYVLKLNSYDLGVDLELADAVQRVRFEHPAVKVLVLTSQKPNIFCSGANIYMLGSSTHAFKVNFCKFTNETRLYLEDLAEHSGVRTLAALNGTASGGGYELAMACDTILLQDDGNTAVSLPEVPLLGVLPGTGGLTRLVDKRKVRRDLADAFSTVAEGVRGKRAVEWRLVDEVAPKSRFEAAVAGAVSRLAASVPERRGAGVHLPPLAPRREGDTVRYTHVTARFDAERRVAELTVRAPAGAPPASAEALRAEGAATWALAAFRELDDALLDLRLNHLTTGLLVLRTEGPAAEAGAPPGDAAEGRLAGHGTGDAAEGRLAGHGTGEVAAQVLAHDAAVLGLAQGGDWFAREIVLHMKRVLKRLDLSARTIFALIEPGSAFAGSLLELALAADRTFMLDAEGGPAIQLGPMNHGPLPMSNGLTRLATRFLAEPAAAEALRARTEPLDAAAALAAGLVTFTPDDIDWEDEVRIAIEERAAFSPDALTGMEASLRFAGPETMETKIFGRLSAWQNWIFQRPNAVGERGALTLYGSPERPSFDYKRC